MERKKIATYSLSSMTDVYIKMMVDLWMCAHGDVYLCSVNVCRCICICVEMYILTNVYICIYMYVHVLKEV